MDFITFDRDAHRVFDQPASYKLADTVLSTMSLVRRNGSEVDKALTLAKQLVAAAPKGTPKRVVLFTDTLTRKSLSATHALDTGALLHVVTPVEEWSSLQRVDHHAWLTAVEKRGGTMWRGAASAAAVNRNDEVFEELARPMALHNVHVRILGTTHNKRHERLEEGDYRNWIDIMKPSAARVRVTAKLWGKTVSATGKPTAKDNQPWERRVLHSEVTDRLTPAEIRRLGFRTRSLTEHTSLAVSTKGRRQQHLGGIGLGSVGTSCRCGFHQAAATSGSGPMPNLREAIRAAYTRCGGTSEPANAKVETTGEEIVDVMVTSANPALRQCLETRLWKTPLTGRSTSPKANNSVSMPLP